MKFIKIFLNILSIAILFLSFSVAANAKSNKLYNSLTLKQIETIMKQQGYNVELYEDKEVVAWTSNRYNDSISLITTDNSNSLNFYTYEKGSNYSFTVNDANNWNKKYKYSKIYIDKDNDIIIELDLDLTGGITEDRIIDFFKTCDMSLNKFMEVIKK
jgi:hypothetical protein